MSLPSWWCSGPFGPIDADVPDFTTCFHYTCIALPVPIVFIILGMVRHCCRRRGEHTRSVYQQLMENAGVNGEAFGNNSDISSTVGRNFAQLCTKWSRPLWCALIVLMIFPFAEIVIRFILGVLLDKRLYPFMAIISEEVLRVCSYAFSMWIMLSQSRITPLVRVFWIAQLVVSAKEIESGLLRTVHGSPDEILLIHCLKFIFNIIVAVYALSPDCVGEDDVLWPAHSISRTYTLAPSGALTPQSYQEKPSSSRPGPGPGPGGGGFFFGFFGRNYTAPTNREAATRASQSRSEASESVWNAFLHEDGARGHGATISPPPIKDDHKSDISSNLLSSDGKIAVGSYESQDMSLGARTRGGAPEFSEATLRITTWLVRTRKKGEEVNFAVQVMVPYEMGKRLGAESGTFRVWRSWTRFQTLDAEIRRLASMHRISDPELPTRRSRSGSGAQKNIEADRNALELYINQVLADRRYWRPLARFLHVDTRVSVSGSNRRGGSSGNPLLAPTSISQGGGSVHKASFSSTMAGAGGAGGAPPRKGSFVSNVTLGISRQDRSISRSFGSEPTYAANGQEVKAIIQPGDVTTTPSATIVARSGSLRHPKTSDVLTEGSENAGRTVALPDHILRFFEDLFEVSVSEWSKWTSSDRGGSVRGLDMGVVFFSISVRMRSGNSWEVRRSFQDARGLLRDIKGQVGSSRAGRLPVLTRDPRVQDSDATLDRAQDELERCIQEIANTNIFHCEALHAFLQPTSNSAVPIQMDRSTPQASTPIANTPPVEPHKHSLPSIGSLETKAGLDIEKLAHAGGGDGNGANDSANYTHGQNASKGILLFASTEDSKLFYNSSSVNASKKLNDIAGAFSMGVRTWEKKLPGGSHNLCFRGSDAVDYLVLHGYARDRKHAEEIGNEMMESLRLFNHIDLSCAFFDDKNLVYVFNSEERSGGLGFASGKAISSLGQADEVDEDAHNNAAPKLESKRGGIDSALRQAERVEYGGESGSGRTLENNDDGKQPEISSELQVNREDGQIPFNDGDSFGNLSGIPIEGSRAADTSMHVGSNISAQSDVPPEKRGNLRKESLFVEGKNKTKQEFFFAGKGGRRTSQLSTHRFEATVKGYMPGSPVLYNIHVREYYSTTNFLDYNIRRRYSDFEKLRKKLVRTHGEKRVPDLPTKIQGLMTKKATFLKDRARGLELFLKRVINTQAFQGHELFEFLMKNKAQQPLTLGSQVSSMDPDAILSQHSTPHSSMGHPAGKS
mmetsp:Transcript_8218/g.20184  ORF Transcript_8218/g.20184 Transcript_8218/m.20184 type:complete len:1244 (-) Transcript_8218:221-3952(-)